MDSASREEKLSRQKLLKNSDQVDDNNEESEDGVYKDDLEEQLKRKKTQYPDRLHVLLLLGYVPLIFLSIILYTFDRKSIGERACRHPDLLKSPALRDGAIEYELRKIPVNFRKSPFAGPPSAEVDAAWHDLVEISNIRVSERDLLALNLTSVALADGSGYVAELGVFHEMHCLKRIRHWMYKEHYHQNQSESVMEENEGHVNHCIEMFRMNSMCKADLSLSTFRWIGEKTPQLTAEDVSPHQCVKWDLLEDWLKQRTVDIRDSSQFVLPSR